MSGLNVYAYSVRLESGEEVLIRPQPDQVVLETVPAFGPELTEEQILALPSRTETLTYEEYEALRAKDPRYPALARSAEPAKIRYNASPQPGSPGNVCGTIVPCTETAPADADSEPPATAETPEEHSFEAWLRANAQSIADGAMQWGQEFTASGMEAAKEAASYYIDNVSQAAHGMADQAMRVGSGIATVGAGLAGAGAAMSTTVIGAPAGAATTIAGVAVTAVGAGVTVAGGVVSGVSTALDSLAMALETGQAPEILNPLLRFGSHAMQRIVTDKIDKYINKKKSGEGGVVTGPPKRKGDPRCKLRPYTEANRLACQPNTLHHAVPDHVFHAKNGQRYPGAPTLTQGLGICVEGKTKASGADGTSKKQGMFGKLTDYVASLADHGAIHWSLDMREAMLGLMGSPMGSSALGKMEDAAASAVSLVTGCDRSDLKNQLRSYHQEQFGLNPKIKVRADPTGRLFDDPPFEIMGRPDRTPGGVGRY